MTTTLDQYFTAGEIESAIYHLHNELTRNPSDQEIAAYLVTNVNTLQTSLQSAAQLLMSTENPLFGDNGKLLEGIDGRGRLRNGLQGLTEYERLVLSLYYEQALMIEEISYVLDMPEAQVSQIYSKAVLTLRATL